MKIRCEHWSGEEGERWGKCSEGLFGGRPSNGVCLTICRRCEIGVGDLVALAAQGTGIGKVVKKLAGEKGCDCPKRQSTLNQRMPLKEQT
jgi:hypothetical protein